MITDLRCLFGHHDFQLSVTCTHLRHCSRCDRAYVSNSQAKRWLREGRASGNLRLRQTISTYLFRDASWKCPSNSMWRALRRGEESFGD